MTQQVHLIFKTHLDVGFTSYASVVIQNYFNRHIPAALRLAREMRESGEGERFIWTTGSWLIYEYLEQASMSERKVMEEGIIAGDIAWHALPFTTHTELMDADLFRFGLSLSKILDTRFGRKTIAAKMTDVPGHTRAIIPLLAEVGITFLHIGVNPGSTVPSVPGLFRWQDPTGAEVMVMYESGYGDAAMIPGFDHCLAFGHTSDNIGPQTLADVKVVFSEMRTRLPGSHVFASTLSDYGRELEKIRLALPVVREEIGDTWIHGIGSDPIKVSRYRELLRLRREWAMSGRVSALDERLRGFNRWLLMVPEHTWGMDEKTYLGDHEHYSAEKFKASRNQPSFKTFEASWVEKRAYPQLAVNALEDEQLASEARERLESIRPVRPDLSAWEEVTSSGFALENGQIKCTFDLDTGTINALTEKTSGTQWADSVRSLGSVAYQSFSAADYDRFFNSYIIPAQRHGWAEEDFCKPGLLPGEAESALFSPKVVRGYKRIAPGAKEVLFHAQFDEAPTHRYGLPGNLFLRYTLSAQQSGIELDLQWFDKQASRLPGAYWFSFQPIPRIDSSWVIEKLGQEITPHSVVENGNRHLHASGDYVACRTPRASLKISSLDAPLVAPGQRSLLDFNNNQPNMNEGVHFCLLNNLWGTNFPMWFEEDCRFRFHLVFGPGKEANA